MRALRRRLAIPILLALPALLAAPPGALAQEDLSRASMEYIEAIREVNKQHVLKPGKAKEADLRARLPRSAAPPPSRCPRPEPRATGHQRRQGNRRAPGLRPVHRGPAPEGSLAAAPCPFVRGGHPSRDPRGGGEAGELEGWSVTLEEVIWLADPLHPGDRCEVQVRYRARAVPAVIESAEAGRLVLRLLEAARAITPGQSGVLYGEGERLLGGGVIA